VDLKLLADEGWFLFGQSDSANYYAVVLNKKGELRLDHVVDAMDAGSPQLFKYVPAKGLNRLRIYRRGEDVFVSVNESMITSYKYQPFHGNGMSFFLPYKGEIEVGSVAALEFGKVQAKAGNGRFDRTVLADPETGWKPAASAFFVTSTGYLVTSHKALEGARSIGVTQMFKGKRIVLNAKLVASDAQNDLALLKVEDLRFKQPGVIPYRFSASAAEPGEAIYTLGYSLSGIRTDELAINDGVVSARSGAGGDNRVYQVTTPVTTGNNGGPVLDRSGNVVGLNSASLSGEANHAIKGALILNMLQSLDNPPKLSAGTLLRNKSLKDQVKLVQGFVALVCVK
jgi:S1-C subfamily serine protease